MNKLHTLAFYTLVTPAITLGAGSLLAQPSYGSDDDQKPQSAQSDKDAKQSTRSTSQNDQNAQRTRHSDPAASASGENSRDQSRMHYQGYMASVPANGMQSSDLIGAEVSTTNGEDLGSVNELIIDENGQIAAIVVGVGGFLGLGQKDVAIGWDDVTRSGLSDEQELRIDATREDLRSAPEFEVQD